MLKKVRDEWGYGSCTELKEWGRGVDMNIFSPERRSESFRASRGIAESDVVVLWVSRLVPEKRPDIWMETVRRLQEEGLPVKALVVGNGTFEKYLSKLKHVCCLGWLSGNALGEAYASSDILLFPSDVETFGNVTLEALSSGCPSVVEKKCGDHLVENGVNGLTCPCGDFEAFYQATRRLVLDTQLRRAMGVAAREKAHKFERGVILQQMAENYKVSAAVRLWLRICSLADCALAGRHRQAPRPGLPEEVHGLARGRGAQLPVHRVLQLLLRQAGGRALPQHLARRAGPRGPLCGVRVGDAVAHELLGLHDQLQRPHRARCLGAAAAGRARRGGAAPGGEWRQQRQVRRQGQEGRRAAVHGSGLSYGRAVLAGLVRVGGEADPRGDDPLLGGHRAALRVRLVHRLGA